MIYHICQKGVWEEAKKVGRYSADSLASQGFIHCSDEGQVVGVANHIFKGRTDLVLLKIDPNKLSSKVRYEGVEGGEKYPHIYGPISLSSVITLFDFSCERDGGFVLPQV